MKDDKLINNEIERQDNSEYTKLIDNNETEIPLKPMQQNKKNDLLKNLFSVFKSILFGLALGLVGLFIFKSLNLTTVRVDGTSMFPTYKDGQIVIFKKDKPKNNGIIVFNPPTSWDTNTNKLYIKRIVAKGGQKLTIENNEIRVNGKLFRKVSAGYLNGIKKVSMTIPKNEYFVMGDNYTQSNDSLYNYKNQSQQFLISNNEILFTAKGKPLKLNQ